MMACMCVSIIAIIIFHIIISFLAIKQLFCEYPFDWCEVSFYSGGSKPPPYGEDFACAFLLAWVCIVCPDTQPSAHGKTAKKFMQNKSTGLELFCFSGRLKIRTICFIFSFIFGLH